MGISLLQFLTFLLTSAGLFFGVMAYTRRNDNFFTLGIISLVIAIICALVDAEIYFYAILWGDIMTIGLLLAFLTAIVFLALSQLKSGASGSLPVTEDYLNSIIEAEDEEWDPES